jgi:hypothetical protein
MGQDRIVCCLALDGSELNTASVARLGAEIRERGPNASCMIVDCSTIQVLTPDGLAALLELGARVAGMWRVVLASLGRTFVRHAIDVGLAERFAIYASVEAAKHALREQGD